MKNLFKLLEQYETIRHYGIDEVTKDVANIIYLELIELGFLSHELLDINEIQDILLVDLDYEFADEDYLILLSEDIQGIALEDISLRLVEMIDEEVNPDNLPEFQYMVVNNVIDLDKGMKTTNLVNTIFNSYVEINEYVDFKGMELATDYLIAKDDTQVGFMGAMALEEAFELMTELGVAGEVIAEQIPDGASAVALLVHTSKNHTTIDKAEVYAIYEVTNVNTEL